MDIEIEKMKIMQKSSLLAYFLWFFLGFIGIHRFYTKQKLAWLFIVLTVLGYVLYIFGIALSMSMCTSGVPLMVVGLIFFLVIFVWWLIDGIKLNSKVQKFNLALLDKLKEEENLQEAPKEEAKKVPKKIVSKKVNTKSKKEEK